MKLLTISALLTTLVNFSIGHVTPSPRIVNGTEVTNRSEFAYQALLFLSGITPYCGATLIGNKHVLTAAHCIVLYNNQPLDLSFVFVVLGTLNAYDRTNMKLVRRVYVHEDYDEDTLAFDIALIELSESFESWTDDIRPIELETEETTNGTCIVSGWGTTAYGGNQMNEKLLYAEVPIADWEQCNEAYLELDGISIGENVICAGGTGETDSCQGDSGGPLVCSGKLAGIVSYGYKCAEEGFPGVYTEVAKYSEWIAYHISLASTTTSTAEFTTTTDSSTSPTTTVTTVETTPVSDGGLSTLNTTQSTIPATTVAPSSAKVNSSITVLNLLLIFTIIFVKI